MKKNKKEIRKEKMNERISYIKEFAKKMGYSINDYEYENCINSRPSRSVELLGTSDVEGNPYGWAWYIDTYEEYNND